MRKQVVIAFIVPVLIIGAAGNPFQKRIPKDSEAIHALTRLTFGPRPGDIEDVKKTGVKKWIELQLDPKSIPEDPKLETFVPAKGRTEGISFQVPQQDALGRARYLSVARFNVAE